MDNQFSKMKLDLSNPFERKKAEARFSKLCEKGAKIELTEFRPNTKSPNIHKYAHVCIDLFGGYLGYKSKSAKEFFKREFASAFPEIATYKENGQTFIKSFQNGRDDDETLFHREECETFIDWIRETANDHGYYIPSSDEYNKSETLQWEIEKELQHFM